MKSLRKLKYAKNEVRNLRRSLDTSLKDRENIRVLLQRAKKLDSQGARKQRTNNQMGHNFVRKKRMSVFSETRQPRTIPALVL